jgi:uncharacterized Ntn-hydrolase superfamily protein
VGAIVPWVRAGVGAVATQAFANTAYGPRALELLAAGQTPDRVAQELIDSDEHRADRQFGIVDAAGRAISYTGAKCIGWAGGVSEPKFAAQGNCLAGPAVVQALASTFRTTTGTLADRLLAALASAQAAGGDKRGQQSAALIVEKPGAGYAGYNDRFVDLRVDDHAAPIQELARLLDLHKLYFFPAEPQDVLPIDDALGREIVRELVRAGALESGDGFDERARSALVAFMHVENLENRVREDGAIDRQTLQYLRSYRPVSK